MTNVFLTNLEAYNNGDLVGRWLELPMNSNQLSEVVLEICKVENNYILTDYEGFGSAEGIREYGDVFKLNENLNKIAESDIDIEIFEAILEDEIIDLHSECDFDNLINKASNKTVLYNVENDYDLGYEFYAIVCGEVSNKSYYLDEESLKRDLEIDGVEEYEIEEMLENPVEFLGDDVYDRYFDYEALGRDLRLGGDFFIASNGIAVSSC